MHSTKSGRYAMLTPSRTPLKKKDQRKVKKKKKTSRKYVNIVEQPFLFRKHITSARKGSVPYGMETAMDILYTPTA